MKNDSIFDVCLQTNELNKYKIINNLCGNEKKNYITSTLISYYDRDDVLVYNNINEFDLICPICLNILNIPKSCSINERSHSFCKKCIDKYLKNDKRCPICKKVFEYKDNNTINSLLYKLFFKCHYSNKGCNKIVNYKEYFIHLNNCVYNDIVFECQIKKFII